MLFEEYKDCDTHQDQDHGPWHTPQQNHGVNLEKTHQHSEITLHFDKTTSLSEREEESLRSKHHKMELRITRDRQEVQNRVLQKDRTVKHQQPWGSGSGS
jgi:hypothetical protein